MVRIAAAVVVVMGGCSSSGVATIEPSPAPTPASTPAAASTPEPATTLTVSGGVVDPSGFVSGTPARLEIEVVQELPRADDTFTQGLESRGDELFETGGLYGESRIRVVDPSDYRELRSADLPEDVFAEGLTFVGDRIYVLTWREEIVFVVDPASLAVVDTLTLAGEGWGICEQDDGDIVTSDGSDRLTFRTPGLEPRGQVTVTRAGERVDLINELECVGSTVWANVWLTDEIVAIDAESGAVTATVDASGLIEPSPALDDVDAVLNGIAHLGGDLFMITGKLWPRAFVVRFVSAGTGNGGG